MGNGRIRSIKPEWRTDEHLKAASDEARVLSIALITMADDYGNGDACDLALAGEVWGALNNPQDSLGRVSRGIRELADFGYVFVYLVNGQKYYHLNNWAKHQRVSHPGLPRFPGPQRSDIIEENSSGISPEELPRNSRDSREFLVPDKEEDKDKEEEEELGGGGLGRYSRDSAAKKSRIALAKSLPGSASLSPTKKKLLVRHIGEALELWEHQNSVRNEAMPRSTALKATAERVTRVAARLEAGATIEECRAVLAFYAREARSKPESARWFNGETNWRSANFDRALGQVGLNPDGGAKPASQAKRIFDLSEEMRKEREERERGEECEKTNP